MNAIETDNAIYFYTAANKYGFLSNFYKCVFKDNRDINYCCTEQYFMYKKCELFDATNRVLLNKILAETSPTQIKAYGRQVKNFKGDVWENKKYDIMCDALHLKFEQNKALMKKLKDTGTKLLYEAAKRDRIWGIGFNAKDAVTTDKTEYGENLLGQALMFIRDA